jgi:hypothetical protein
MSVPRGLDRAGKLAFREAAAIVTELGDDPELSRPALLAYARVESTVAMLREQWLADPRGVLVGGRGALRANPILAELAKWEKLASELRDSLALSPTGRRRAGRAVRGRPQGAASAADRRQPPTRRAGNVKLFPLPREIEEMIDAGGR